mgnify:FL=1
MDNWHKTNPIEYLKRDYIIEGLTNCCVEYDENGEEIFIIEKTKWTNMITAEHWMEGINSVLDEYGLSREEFWKDPKAFLDNLDDMDAKLTLEYFMEVV